MNYRIDEQHCRNLDYASSREWLLTNGLGGFSMGTVSGINTRRYHGHLISATRAPAQRTLLLASIEATMTVDGATFPLSTNQYPGAVFPEGYQLVESFEAGPESVSWTFRSGTNKVRKTIAMRQGENAVTVRYENLGRSTIQLSLRPLIAHRSYHGNFSEADDYPESLTFPTGATVVRHDGIELSVFHPRAVRSPIQGWYFRFEHDREVERGLNPRDDLFCPCELNYLLGPREEAVLVASSDGEKAPFTPEASKKRQSPSLRAQLSDAAERFLVQTPARASIIAGYPWFTDWGRDTMISLPGICLATGKVAVARQILLDYADQLNKGLIPNRFVEMGEEAEYNTVDATLWFANAIYKTLQAEWDDGFAKIMATTLNEVFVWHVGGTKHGIKMDAEDGLLSQGEQGVQLTWMDAKVGDWVVTPRHGKPVEINGLWINALRVMEWLAERLGRTGEKYRKVAEKAEASFQEKFWAESRGHYFDTIEPCDASLRPNQIIAMALPFGPATGERALAALTLCESELLTPRGIRTLGPREPGYRGEFKGPLPELDAAYHQGTVWPWLLGPFATAAAKLRNDPKEAKIVLRYVREMLDECGLGGISEVYDGDMPQSPGGCPWQAWSVAEPLRAWVEDAGGD